MRKKKSMARKKKNYILLIIIIAILSIVAGLLLSPSIRERLSYKIAVIRSDIFYYFNPPEDVVFNPTQQQQMNELVAATITAMFPTITPTPVSTVTIESTQLITSTPTSTPLPTPTPTAIPNKVNLTGIILENQHFNNCGPANLSMYLSYWGWEGDQTITGNYLKPNQKDRNVMPYEMVDFVQTQTQYGVILRYGGDLEMIKRFVAAGFPVLIERAIVVIDKGWMGHYGLITGYDDAQEVFYIPDTYFGTAKPTVKYAELNQLWPHFDNIYLVVYPPDRQEEVMGILGDQADSANNINYALQLAIDRTLTTTGRDNFFAWYMKGNMLVQKNDYLGAAQAYDTAFMVYSELTLGQRPWRTLWYQTGPYFAYYYTGRYYDLVNLATQTLKDQTSFGFLYEPAIEETWVWRGRAKLMLGEQAEAISDFREALKWHPDWWVAIQELQNLGVTP